MIDELRLPSLKEKDVVFSGISFTKDGCTNAYAGWREGKSIKMEYGHNSVRALEDALTKRLHG